MVVMGKSFNWTCIHCGGLFDEKTSYKLYNDKHYCEDCWNIGNPTYKMNIGVDASKINYNEPEHYHKHEIDTIEFLQKGFPPEVFMGFALGSIIKYAQRANYKNGREDFVKMVDYSKRVLDWYDQTATKRPRE